MAVSTIVGVVVVGLLMVACWYVMRRPPSAANERRAVEESRMRAEIDMTNAQRHPGMFGRGSGGT
jgi:hypothetical protein